MFVRALAVFLIPLFVGACGLSGEQSKAIEGFGKASSSFGESVSDRLAEARSDVVTLNSHTAALAPELLTAKEKNDPAGALSSDRIAARVAAAEAVATYGQLLVALSTADETENLKTAGDKFVASVKGLPGSDRVLSSDQLDSVGQVVAAIGGIYIEHLKARAIRQIVPKAAPQVEKIASLFEIEFSERGDPKNPAMYSYVSSVSQRTARGAEKVLDSPRRSLADRAYAAEAYSKALTAKAKYDATFDAAGKAAGKMSLAHRQIVEALAGGKIAFTDIEQFGQHVLALVQAAKGLK